MACVGRSLRVIDPEGRQAPPELVTTGTAAPIAALGARGDALVLWDDDAEVCGRSTVRRWARWAHPSRL